MSWNSSVVLSALRLLPLSMRDQQNLWNAAVNGRPVVFVGDGQARNEVVKFARHLALGWETSDAAKAEVRSIAKVARVKHLLGIPFRVPHFSATSVGVFGSLRRDGGVNFGELSLAHHGVLVFDDLTDFDPAVFVRLGQVLRDGAVKLKADNKTAELPARPRFVFGVAGACRCGLSGCRCPADVRSRHESRVAKYASLLGAIRIDLHDVAVEHRRAA